MKRKYVLAILLSIIISMYVDVYACGEINELKSNIGTVTVLDDSNFLVTIPSGTKEVILTGSTNYTWVDGYRPGKVSTSDVVQLKVDGNACGYGIYTYFVKFKELSTAIAENDTPQENNNIEETTENSLEENKIVEDNLILSGLTIEGLDDFTFSPTTYNYTIDVENDVTSLKITPTVLEGVTFEISENVNNLKEGENVIAITLMNESGNTKVYNIIVNRLEPKSDNNYLASIIVAGYTLNFDPSITNYTLEIGKESILNIQVETESELATYAIVGNSNLDDGSVITIRVTAEDESTKDYKITVKRVFNIMDYWIYIVIILLVLLIVLLLVIMKKKHKKNKVGPATIEGSKDTAGTIQEVKPNIEPASKEPVKTPSTSVKASELKIIKPTNIESPVQTVNNQNNLENNPTEVFKL